MEQIPQKLLAQASAKLQDAGISPAGLRFDGRDGYLRGVAGSPEVSERARQIVESVWGVRYPVTLEPVDQPAPPPAEPKPVERIQSQIKEVIKLKGIEFLTGSAQLTPNGRAVLDEVAAVLNKAATVSVDIEGHTDNQGVADSNQRLSEQRAAAVKAYLVSKGVTSSRMGTAGFGQTRPIADNNTAEGRQANRRIEFKVKEQ
ncbi:MAG: OmpA family protein [Bryobacteraceae bacterium]